MTTRDPYGVAIAYARDLGTERGRNAAGWYVQDTIGGRVTGDPRKAAEYILRGIDDGDSAVTDGFPYADLSGEWAGTLTGPQLVDDAMATAFPTVEGYDQEREDDWFADICDAYETAFNQAAQDAIASAARDILR
jgi:hypothetical protein